MNKLFFYISAMLVVAFTSCKKNSETPGSKNPTDELVKVSEGYAVGASTKVELWAHQELSSGYEQLFIALYDSVSKKRITHAGLTITPVKEQSGSRSTSPSENPESENAQNGLFPCSAIFWSSLTGNDREWYMEVQVKREGQAKRGKAMLPLQIKRSQPERVSAILSIDHTALLISYNMPKPKVGINDFELIIYRGDNLIKYSPMDDYTVVMTPTMPSMGHGSPNNVNPVPIGNGHYRGKVNFTMTGRWRIKLELIKNGKTTTTSFDVVLQ